MMDREAVKTDRSGNEPATKMVLVIDADDTSRLLLCSGLEGAGYAVAAAANAAAASQWLQSRRFNVVVLDGDMPAGGLNEVLEALGCEGAYGEDRPLLLVTGGRDSQIWGRAAGFADQHLGKPIDMAALAETIEASLARRSVADGLHLVLAPPEEAIPGPIGSRRWARFEAEELRDVLVAALDAIDQGFVVWDPSDRLLICNKSFRRLFGSNARHLVPGAQFEAVMRRQVDAGAFRRGVSHPRQWLEECLSRHRNPKGPFEEEYSDGSWVRIAEHRIPAGYTVGIYTDVSEAKRREIALKTFAENNRRLASAVNATSSVVLITDPNRPGNPTVFANPAFTEMTGWPVEEALGRDRSFLNGPETNTEEARRFEQDMRAGRQAAADLLLTSRSGKAFRARLSASPIRDSDGRIANWVIVQTDMTERTSTGNDSPLVHEMEMIVRSAGRPAATSTIS